MTDHTSGEKAIQFIADALLANRTVHISTMTRVVAVSPKTAEKWEKSGHPLFKLIDGDLYMASGRAFVKLTAGALTLVGISAKEGR